MSHELEIVMKRSIKFFWLVLLLLFTYPINFVRVGAMPAADVAVPQPNPSQPVAADLQPSNIPTQIVEPDNVLQTAEAPAGPSDVGPSSVPTPSAGPSVPVAEEKDIYLNFDNADLSNFVNYIAEIRKMNLVIDKSIEGAKISLTIREPLTAEGAWNVFLTVLEMAGFSIINVGDVNKVIPKDQKMTQPLPSYINVSPNTLPDNDINIRYVMFLSNLDVSTISDLLQSMLSDKGAQLAVKEVNGFVITDKSLNVKAAAKLLFELDQMGSAEAVTVIKLKNANATDVKTLLDSLIKTPEVSPLARLLGKTAEGTTSYFPPGTRVIAEERTNSLILLGSPKPIKKIEEFIVNHLDTELKEAKSPLHVFELQYTDAQQIADILKEATQTPESVAGQAASKYGAIRGGVKYFRNMNFKVDKDGNRLIVASADRVDWKLLKQTIKDLDKPQPQVAIESMIVTVDVEDDKKLGGAIRNKKHQMLGINIDAQSAGLTDSPQLEYKPPEGQTNPISLLGNMINQITPQQGLATLTFGKPGNIWGVLEALKSQTNTSVLSQPFMTIANKTSANIVVGREQRVVQETQGTGGLTGYESITANTDLTIVPQINIDGLVRLDIDLKIDEFINEAAGSKTKRNLKTNVAVADGQVLVLGGFVKTKVQETKHKTPLLGDIPVLGWLFKNQTRIITKEYLFIFLCPTIVKPRQTPGMNLYSKMKLHEATDSIESGIMTKRTPDPVYNWFFNPEKENYSHKVIDFANARYQPTTVDIKNDPYYRAQTKRGEFKEEAEEERELVAEGEIQKQRPQDVPGMQVSTFPTNPAQPQALALNVPVQPVYQSQAVSPVQAQDQIVTPQVAAPILPVQQPSPEVIMPPAQVSQATVQQSAIPQAQPVMQQQPVAPASEIVMPVIESEKREELKKFISAPPEAVKVVAPSQVVQPVPVQVSPALPEAEIKRDEFKRFIAPESKIVEHRTQDLNFDMSKRNRLKDFLSKNPRLKNRRTKVRKSKKEAFA